MKRLGISVIALCAAMPALAQDIALDEIVVSANKAQNERARTGVSVSVVTAEDLEQSAETSLAGYFARLPGVTVTRNGPMGTTASVRLRGTAPQFTAVYVDGIRVDDPSGTQVSFNFGALLPSGIQRIEVLRGSHSALYGGSAVGGVINITTVDDSAENGLSQTLAAEIGSYGTANLSYGLRNVTDRGFVSFNLTRQHSDGFSARVGGAGPLDDDGFDSTRASLSLRYAVSDALTLGATVFHQDTDVDYDISLADQTGEETRRETGVGGFAEYQAGNTVHRFDVTSYDVTRSYFSAGVLSYTATGRRLAFNYQGTTEVSPALTFVYGADSTEETSEGVGKTRVNGLFAQAIWSPVDTVDLSAALRNDSNSTFGNYLSGRVAGAWQAQEGLTLRASYGTGFRAPSVFEQTPVPAWGIAVMPGLSPETSKSYEIGLDADLGQGVEATATVFQTEIDNAITYCESVAVPWAPACLNPIPVGNTSMYENVPGLSVARGLELGVKAPLGDAMTFAATYTYTDSQRPDASRAPNVPRHSLGLSLDRDFGRGVKGGVDLRHVADNPEASVKDFTVVNARFSYAINEMADLSLRVENVFDTTYEEIGGYGTARRSVYLGVDAKF